MNDYLDGLLARSFQYAPDEQTAPPIVRPRPVSRFETPEAAPLEEIDLVVRPRPAAPLADVPSEPFRAAPPGSPPPPAPQGAVEGTAERVLIPPEEPPQPPPAARDIVRDSAGVFHTSHTISEQPILLTPEVPQRRSEPPERGQIEPRRAPGDNAPERAPDLTTHIAREFREIHERETLLRPLVAPDDTRLDAPAQGAPGFAPPPAPPTIRVSIGQIVVQAVRPTEAPGRARPSEARPAVPAPRMSLEQYLKQRSKR